MNRSTRLLSIVPLLALLAVGAGWMPAAAPNLSAGGILGISAQIPPISRVVAILSAVQKSNATGQVSANVGGEFLSVQQSTTTHQGALVFAPGPGHVLLRAASGSGRASIVLVLVGQGDSWQLKAAQIQDSDGAVYTASKGNVSASVGAHHTISGTFSLTANRVGHLGDTIEVSHGQFSVRLHM